MVVDLMRWCTGGVAVAMLASWRAYRGIITSVDILAGGEAAVIWLERVETQEDAYDEWKADPTVKNLLIERLPSAVVLDSWRLQMVLVLPEITGVDGPEEIVSVVLLAPSSPALRGV